MHRIRTLPSPAQRATSKAAFGKHHGSFTPAGISGGRSPCVRLGRSGSIFKTIPVVAHCPATGQFHGVQSLWQQVLSYLFAVLALPDVRSPHSKSIGGRIANVLCLLDILFSKSNTLSGFEWGYSPLWSCRAKSRRMLSIMARSSPERVLDSFFNSRCWVGFKYFRSSRYPSITLTPPPCFPRVVIIGYAHDSSSIS